MTVVARTLQHWESGNVVVMNEAKKRIGEAQAVLGLHGWLPERAGGIAFSGVEFPLFDWAQKLAGGRFTVLVQDNRRKQAYQVMGFVSELSGIRRSAMGWTVDSVNLIEL